MQSDRFTIKSQEALSAGLSLAARRKHSQSQPEHLLAALLEQAEGFVPSVLRKLGTSVEVIRSEFNAALDALPTLGSADEPTTSRELLTVLRAAETETGKLRDDYISTEH